MQYMWEQVKRLMVESMKEVCVWWNDEVKDAAGRNEVLEQGVS